MIMVSLGSRIAMGVLGPAVLFVALAVRRRGIWPGGRPSKKSPCVQEEKGNKVGTAVCEEEECPICLEEWDSLTKAVTPCG